MAEKKRKFPGVKRFRMTGRTPAKNKKETEPEPESQLTETETEIPAILPVLAVRDVVIFDNMILPLFIGRDKSVKAVEAAVERGRKLIVCAQRDENNDDPGPADLYQTGALIQIMRILKMPDSRVKILAQSLGRVKITHYTSVDPYLDAEYKLLDTPEIAPDSPESAEAEALLRATKEQSEKVLALRGMGSNELINLIQGIDEPGRLADLIAANLRIKIDVAQKLLETVNPLDRLRKINDLLSHEIEVATVQARIQGAAREGMDKAQKEFYLREQIKAIRQELGEAESDLNDDIASLKEALKAAGLSKEANEEANKQLKRLAGMHGDSAEANVARSYLEWLSELPWKKLTKDKLDIKAAKKILDEDHCGLYKIKDRILEFLSVRKLNPNSKGGILCFAGPPGVGKTSLGKSIARAMGRKFQRISLGGMHDEAEIRGHRRTYIGSMPGRIIQSLKQAGSRNPVIMLDEIDKIGADFRGDPASALLEALDPEQNANFSDHYLNVPFDLSKVMFICTANNLDPIPAALRDRMEVLSLSGYTEHEKVEIARMHLLPKQIENVGLKENDIEISDDLISIIIREYTRESGVRNLERTLASICRKLARKRAEGIKDTFILDKDSIHTLLGAPKYIENEKDSELPPGIAIGLAWTPAGGEVLNIEANIVKGRGNLLLTGQLGDVMKESAQAALSYIRSRENELGIEDSFISRKDIHIHVPAGGTPKDGPSAGITITTALISAITGKSARPDLCMTGEITLQGRVLPVGGIKEKILAGVARGFKHVIIPHQNIKDLEEIPEDLKSRIQIHPVRHYDEVRPLVFAENFPQEPEKKSGKTKKKNSSSKPEQAPTPAEA